MNAEDNNDDNSYEDDDTETVCSSRSSICSSRSSQSSVSSSNRSSVSVNSSISDGNSPEYLQWKKTVIVHDVPLNCVKNLEDRLSNKSKGGGTLESCTRDAGSGNVVAIFKHRSDASKIAKLKTVDVGDFQFRISKPPKPDIPDQTSSVDNDDSCSRDGVSSSSSVTSSTRRKSGKSSPESNRTIKVIGVSNDAGEEIVKLYFECARIGGGPIESIKFVGKSEKRKVIITFQHSKDAKNVVKWEKGHTLENRPLKVVLLENAIDAKGFSCAIVVTGLRSLDDEILDLYFTNDGRSGGGVIENLYLDNDNQRAVITFASAAVAERVVQRGSHTLNGIHLQVHPLEPKCPPPFYNQGDNLEKTRLLFRSLPIPTTLSDFTRYVEAKSGSKVTGWIVGSKSSNVILEFNSIPDYSALRYLVSYKPFRCNMISVEKIPVTNWIEVTGIKGISTELLQLYFENPRNADAAIEILDRISDDSAIVEFKNAAVTAAVLGRPHMLDNRQLKVKPYNKQLRCALPSHASNQPETNWAPNSVMVPISPRILKFLMDYPKYKTKIQNELKLLNCIISWQPVNSPVNKVQLKEERASYTAKSRSGWEKKCLAAFQIFIDGFRTSNLQCPDCKIWDDLKTETKNLKSDSMMLDFNFDDGKLEIFVTGEIAEVETFESWLEHRIEDLKEKLRAKEIKTDSVSLKPHQIRLIENSSLIADMSHQFNNLEISCQPNCIVLKGIQENITDAKLKVHEKIVSVTSRRVELPTGVSLAFIKSNTLSKFINDGLRKSSIEASVETSNDNLILYAFTEDVLERGKGWIAEQIIEEKLNAEEQYVDVEHLGGWQRFYEDLRIEFNILEILNNKASKDLTIVCTRRDARKVSVKVKEFIRVNDRKEEIVCAKSKKHFELVQRVKKLELASMVDNLNRHQGKVEVVEESEKFSFTVKGTISTVKDLTQKLKNIVNGIQSKEVQLSKPGISYFVESENGKKFLESLANKHAVDISIASPQGGIHVNFLSTKIHKKIPLTAECSIVLVDGDIASFTVDAIVIPSSQDLIPKNRLSWETIKAGGDGVAEECYLSIKEHGPCLSGNVFVSTPGNLPCKAIIHAVAPVWSGNTEADVKYLSNAINKALTVTSDKKMTSIAFPAMLATPFHMNVLIKTVQEFILEKQRSATNLFLLKDIYFIDKQKSNIISLEKCLENLPEVLSPSTPRISPQSPNISPTVSSPVGSGSRFFAHRNPNSVQTAEGVIVNIHKGSICSLTVDVIVDSTSTSLGLIQGQVSKAILNAAGAAIEVECKQVAPNGIKIGEVVETGGHGLKCKKVYHGAAVAWDGKRNGQSEKVLRSFVKNVLEKAHSNAMTSIAIPAIASGNFKTPPDIVVEILFDEIDKFSATNSPTTLKSICLVAFDQNRECVEAFEKKIRDIISKGMQTSLPISIASLSSTMPHLRPSTNSLDFSSIQPYQHLTTSRDHQRQFGSLVFDSSNVRVKRTKIDLTTFKDDQVLVITGFTANEIDACQEELERRIDPFFSEEILNSRENKRIFSELTDEQINRIDHLQTVHSVCITFESDDVINCCRLVGLKEDVETARKQIEFICSDVV